MMSSAAAGANCPGVGTQLRSKISSWLPTSPLYKEGPAVKSVDRSADISMWGEFCSSLYRLLVGRTRLDRMSGGPSQTRVVKRPEATRGTCRD